MGTMQTGMGLLGGLGLFLYGMKLCSEGLQKAAAQRLKRLVKVLTKTPFRGVAVGAVVTLCLQSSSATSAIVIGFTSVKAISLAQALSVLLGSAVGSSLTVHLIAFDLTPVALGRIFGGTIVYIFMKSVKHRSYGQILLGFGLLFYGMFVMSSAVEPVSNRPWLAATMIHLERNPFFAFLLALIVTTVIQSSAGFLALVISLARQELVGLYALVPFVLGAHLGGTVTGLLSSLGVQGRESKRAGFANFLFKLINGLLFLPFYRPITALMLATATDVSRLIANIHTFFSVMMVVAFLPFTNQIAALMTKMIPERNGGLIEAKYLKEDLMKIPELALDQSQRQTLEMGYFIYEEMLKKIIPMLSFNNEKIITHFAEMEQTVDALTRKIVKYVTSLDLNNYSEDLLLRSLQVLYVANDLEHIGDILMNISQIGIKITAEQLAFSEEGYSEIKNLYEMVAYNYQQALEAFENNDAKLASQIMKEYPKIRRYEKELRYRHFERMQCGNKRTIATSSLHLEMIESLLRIHNHTVNIAQGVVGIV